ncbi:MAG: hypothetical protein ACI9HI_002020 [Salinirussus sp.]|jgi:hypothetical protein
MKTLLERLRDRARTLTVYDYDGSQERLETLAGHLAGYGVAVRTAATDRGKPASVPVFHHGDEVFGTVALDALLPADSIERAFSGEDPFDPAVLPFDVDTDVTVSPETSHGQMVDISRQLEQRALDHGEGWLRVGFQELSTVAESPRTKSVYRRLAETGLDVAVVGYPDVSLSDRPFGVIPDDKGAFQGYWFLLYDGGQPEAKAALVAKHHDPSLYEAFWTVDPETVDELVAIARENYPVLG